MDSLFEINNLIAIILLAVAIMDLIAVNVVMPKLLAKEENGAHTLALIKRLVNIFTVVMFVVALYFYLARPL